jgi:hypothetical protein
MVQRHREREAELIEREAAMTCGRTLEIGRDETGRSYWKFHSDPNALFVCQEASDGASGWWHRFADAEGIASFIVGLGKARIAKDLRRCYPEANEMIKDRSWANALLKRRFPRAVAAFNADQDAVIEDTGPSVLVAGGFEVCCVEIKCEMC